MRCCDLCDEPAVKSALVQDKGGRSRKTVFCYVHAVADGVLDAPLDDIEKLSAKMGYPTNGLLFVLEALVRAAHMDSAEDVSTVIIVSARKRFSGWSRKALERWRILDRPDHAGAVP